MQLADTFQTNEKQIHEQWFDPNNVIHSTVEKLSKIETSDEAAELVDQLDDQVTYHQFLLGGVLSEIQKRGWAGHKEFYNAIDHRHGLKKRKTQYLMSVYKMLIALDVPWEDAKQVGWSNLRVLAPLLDANNVKEWIEKAKGMTHKALVEAVQEFKGTKKKEDPFDGETSTPTYTFTFQVHEDQKPLIVEAVEKAKQEGNTKFDGQALEYIAIDFLAGGKKTSTTIDEMLYQIKEVADTDSIAVDVIMASFCSVFPNAHVDVDLNPQALTSGAPVND
jgi:hypothetical protein